MQLFLQSLSIPSQKGGTIRVGTEVFGCHQSPYKLFGGNGVGYTRLDAITWVHILRVFAFALSLWSFSDFFSLS